MISSKKKPLWDAEIKVNENENLSRRKNEKPSGLCHIFLKIIIGIVLGAAILATSVIQEKKAQIVVKNI